MGRTDTETLTRQLFTDPVQMQARMDLRQSWIRQGLHRDETLTCVARRASEKKGDVRIIAASKKTTHELEISSVWERARVVAAALHHLGVGQGDRVAIQLPNGPEAFVAYLAVNGLGAVLVPIVQIYGPADTRHIIDRSAAKVFILSAREGGPGLEWLTSIGRSVQIVVAGENTPKSATNWSSLEDFNGLLDEPTGGGDTPAALLYTSGTTGQPKGVLHTNSSILAYLDVVPCPSFQFKGTFLWSWPSGHIGGILAALSPFVRLLDTVLFGESWDTDFLIDTIERYAVRGMSGVPTVGLRLIEAVESRKLALPLREFFTGGAFIPTTLVQRAEAQGWHLTRSYGLTENPVPTATVPSDPPPARLMSEGRAVTGSRIRIVGDDGSDCASLDDGEVIVISPQQMIGYDDADLNRTSFTPDGWLRTGDIGHLDSDGYLTITDRKKDIVIRGGENISSQEVERALMLIPGVRETAVVAMPDPDLGERACAYVMLQPGTSIDMDIIRSHFQSLGLARQKCPERLEVVGEFPRTPSGKILKKVLRDGLRAESSEA